MPEQSSTSVTPTRGKCVDDVLGYIVQDVANAAEAPDQVRLMRPALDAARRAEATA